MLTGVVFSRSPGDGDTVRPQFVNKFVLTDVYLAAAGIPSLRTPILPSVATLVNPASTLLRVFARVLRTILLVILSNFPGSHQTIKKISVANTAVLYHDGRALATCESGPPMRVTLPELDTVGWFNGRVAEGEYGDDSQGPVLGGEGPMSFMKEWTTAHPKVDPVTSELVMFHNTFMPPYVHYSVIPAQQGSSALPSPPDMSLNMPVPGIASAKMMHDFGVSRAHTVIMDLPLSLDPINNMKGKAVVSFDESKPSRFGVFPRHRPGDVRWFETAACCIFHTANTWEVYDSQGRLAAVDMLACRMTSAALVFTAGNIDASLNALAAAKKKRRSRLFRRSYGTNNEDSQDRPSLEAAQTEKDALLLPIQGASQSPADDDQSRLYYYSFDFSATNTTNSISNQYALSAIPFEFPSVRPELEMGAARHIYGCSTSMEQFGAALAAVKIDIVVKIDAQALIERGKANPPPSVTGCVDTRTVAEVLASRDPHDPIRCFKMPDGWYAQEPRFVPRDRPSPDAVMDEDDGFLLFYAFDESQLDDVGECRPNARSELWILDAKSMKHVVARVLLPQRVPYGLHGNWFPEDKVLSQRPVRAYRNLREGDDGVGKGRLARTLMSLRRSMEACVA